MKTLVITPEDGKVTKKMLEDIKDAWFSVDDFDLAVDFRGRESIVIHGGMDNQRFDVVDFCNDHFCEYNEDG